LEAGRSWKASFVYRIAAAASGVNYLERNPLIGAYAIGARDGNSALPISPAFHDDVFDVFFEADESATDQIRQRHNPARTRVFPYCLADRNGPGTLLVNYDPYTSSLLPISPDLELSQLAYGVEYPHAVAGAPQRKVPVELRTLDSLDLLADGSVAPPNVLLIDTQGTELAIMRGGRELISEHTVAIITEAEFVQVYEGQPLFGEVSAWLAELGFFFADFSAGPYRANAFGIPLGQRGHSLAIFADALFFRRPASLIENPLLLAKLAFIATMLGHLAVGFHCFDLLAEADPSFSACPVERPYFRLLLELARARAAMPRFSAPTFTDLFPTFEDSNARFDARVSAEEEKTRIAHRTDAIQNIITSQEKELNKLISQAATPIELVLQAFGLHEHANVVKNNRIGAATELLTKFGFEVRSKPPSS
jgi:FkbM family methyltransferase